MNQLDHYNFSTKEGFNATLLKLRYKELSIFFKNGSCLELGCADGEGTKMLLPHFEKIVAVDGSEKLINKAKKEITNKKVSFYVSFFEDFETDEKFDTVILAHILEHVDDPLPVLQVAKRFVKNGGVVLIDVPNALSIHRQVGVLMGMLPSEYSLNEADHSIGHQRVYDMTLLKKDIEKSGLKVVNEGGIFLKPFSNGQMESLLDKSGILAFDEMGKRYPAIAAEIYTICTV